MKLLYEAIYDSVMNATEVEHWINVFIRTN